MMSHESHAPSGWSGQGQEMGIRRGDGDEVGVGVFGWCTLVCSLQLQEIQDLITATISAWPVRCVPCAGTRELRQGTSAAERAAAKLQPSCNTNRGSRILRQLVLAARSTSGGPAATGSLALGLRAGCGPVTNLP
eukprot:scaffold9193_cov90-Isochrysis_galbana.AAC.1